MGSIEIVDYDQNWPHRFSSIGRRLRDAMGDKALRIDHIGSTAVPGLAAKNVIDLMVSVQDLQDRSLRSVVASTGFVWQDDVVSDHRPPGLDLATVDLDKRLAKIKGVNCHFRVAGSYNQRYALLCRDFLRSHPGAGAAYEAVKRALADVTSDVDAYYAVKDPVFDLIMEGANEWAATSRWEPGPSDA